jgi:hypothetical protein
VFRFLHAGGEDPLIGAPWRPGEWVAPRGGIVAYRAADLPR